MTLLLSHSTFIGQPHQGALDAFVAEIAKGKPVVGVDQAALDADQLLMLASRIPEERVKADIGDRRGAPTRPRIARCV